MNDEMRKTFEAINIVKSLTNQKQVLYEELNQNLLYYYEGSTFIADTNLLSFVGSYCSMGKNSLVLMDINKTPVLIENVPEFYRNLLAVYTEAINRYYYEFKEVTNPKSLTEIINND